MKANLHPLLVLFIPKHCIIKTNTLCVYNLLLKLFVVVYVIIKINLYTANIFCVYNNSCYSLIRFHSHIKVIASYPGSLTKEPGYEASFRNTPVVLKTAILRLKENDFRRCFDQML